VHRKDLVVATQGRAVWIVDNLSSLHQITPQTASNMTLYKPRDGYRTSTAAALLGPQIEYYLPTASTDTIKLEILDAAGKIVNTYRSGMAAGGGFGGRGGRGGGGGDAAPADDADAAMMDGRVARAPVGQPMNVVTTTAGLNRFVWNVQDATSLGAPPGKYQARLTLAGTSQTVPFTVLIDPRLAAEGMTAADIAEQRDHNARVRALVTEVGSAVTRVRAGSTRLKGATGAAADTLKRVEVIAEKLNTQPIRYGKPGLQAHASYLSGMTSRGDQKVGKDALARYSVLKKEFDVIAAELNRILPQRVNQ